jgi:hypothetical protein
VASNYIGTTAPDKYFKCNNMYIIDLESGNAHMSSDPLYDMPGNNPEASQHFVALTNGRY